MRCESFAIQCQNGIAGKGIQKMKAPEREMNKKQIERGAVFHAKKECIKEEWSAGLRNTDQDQAPKHESSLKEIGWIAVKFPEDEHSCKWERHGKYKNLLEQKFESLKKVNLKTC